MRRWARLGASTLPICLSAAIGLGALGGCIGGQTTGNYSLATDGSPARGKRLIQNYGCGSCHIIPGVRDARGLVGPPLMFFSRRTMIAGELPNTEANLVRWMKNPHAIEPGTAMPDLGLTDSQSTDIAAYLYTLR